MSDQALWIQPIQSCEILQRIYLSQMEKSGVPADIQLFPQYGKGDAANDPDNGWEGYQTSKDRLTDTLLKCIPIGNWKWMHKDLLMSTPSRTWGISFIEFRYHCAEPAQSCRLRIVRCLRKRPGGGKTYAMSPRNASVSVLWFLEHCPAYSNVPSLLILESLWNHVVEMMIRHINIWQTHL